MHNVAHNNRARTPEARRRHAPAEVAETAPRSTSATRLLDSPSEQRAYGLACLDQGRETLDRMSALVLIDEDDIDVDVYRQLASRLATNLAGARDALEVATPPSSPAPAAEDLPKMARVEAPTDRTHGLDDLGERALPLRAAVDHAVENIEGIVRECRGALDRACAMHIYSTGANEGFYQAETDVHGEFNSAMAEAVGALKCLMSYVDKIRPDAITRAKRRGSLRPLETLDAAAEE